jgi:hypothetical protein
MNRLFILSFILKSTFLFAQDSQPTNSIKPPVYDTINIDIKSTNSFYFCSILYPIPRICDIKDQSNCCSYSAQIKKAEKGLYNGQISCYDGTSLYWLYFDTEETAKKYFENIPNQMKTQMKKLTQEEVKFFLCDKEIPAYRLTSKTLQGYIFTQIIFYGTLNGQSVFGHLSLKKNEKSSTDLTPLFRQLVRF